MRTYADLQTQALSLTAPEVSVLESALNELHGMMRAKRSQVHALEEDLEALNPPVFGAVQVRRVGLYHAVLCCAVLCCAVLCCAVLCCLLQPS